MLQVHGVVDCCGVRVKIKASKFRDNTINHVFIFTIHNQYRVIDKVVRRSRGALGSGIWCLWSPRLMMVENPYGLHSNCVLREGGERKITDQCLGCWLKLQLQVKGQCPLVGSRAWSSDRDNIYVAYRRWFLGVKIAVPLIP